MGLSAESENLRLYFVALLTVVNAAGCGARRSDGTLSCGPGTVQKGAVCLPAPGVGCLVCGAGTHEDSGACLPNSPEVTCGAGTERVETACVALSATSYDVRLPVAEIPADGYSKIPVLAIGRTADGQPSTLPILFAPSRPDAGAFVEPQKTLTPMGIIAYFTPCNAALTPSCTGPFTVTVGLSGATIELVARSAAATLIAPLGLGSAAACLLGGNALFLDGDSGDAVHPGADSVVAGVWTGTHLGGAAPNRVSITVVPTDSAQGSSWTTVFSSEALGQSLNLQVYDFAERVDYAAPAHPGLAVSGDGVVCNTLTGRFEVLDWSVQNDTVLTGFTATFEQHCDGAPAVLRGCVHFAQ
ncbi:MAG: hypothetical protein HY903_04200 [Deltaproteobacteria bacterium]|nr:hypothetical protein [Deltaproteobacteria bacterium]